MRFPNPARFRAKTLLSAIPTPAAGSKNENPDLKEVRPCRFVTRRHVSRWPERFERNES